MLQCKWHHKVVKLSGKPLELCRHEGYILISCDDPLCIQKYVSTFSCGRNKKEQQKFSNEVPIGNLQSILDTLSFGMEESQKCYMAACHLNYTTCVHWVSICMLPFFLSCCLSECLPPARVWTQPCMWETFSWSSTKAKEMPIWWQIIFAKRKGLQVLYYARSASTFSESPPGALWCTRGHWTWQWWLLLLFFFSFGQEEKQGRVCALIHGSGQLTSGSADALVINNSFRTLVIFISVGNPTVFYLTHRWLRTGLVEMPLPFHSDIKDI